MFARITLLLLTVFWLTMGYLLWRSEYVGENEVGSTVPVEVIWRKIRSAPDTSTLKIMHNGVKAGDFRWIPSVAQDIVKNRLLSEDTNVAIGPATVSSYQLSVEGSVTVPEMGGRLQFHSEIKLRTNDSWEEFRITVGLRSAWSWEIYSKASEQTARFVMDDRSMKFEHVFKFTDLQDPQTLMDEFNMPAQFGILGMLGPLPKSKPGSPATFGLQSDLGIQWKARNDRVAIGHSTVRAYRLEATALERYRMRILVSRVGEILRIELPDGWELVNEEQVGL